MIMKKSYAVNLCFGTWRNQLWFSGNEGSEAAFSEAETKLDEVCGSCGNSSEFFEKVTLHFESRGFARICK